MTNHAAQRQVLDVLAMFLLRGSWAVSRVDNLSCSEEATRCCNQSSAGQREWLGSFLNRRELALCADNASEPGSEAIATINEALQLSFLAVLLQARGHR